MRKFETMTKNAIILELEALGLDFNPNDNKDVLHNILIVHKTANYKDVIEEKNLEYYDEIKLINSLISKLTKRAEKDRSKSMRIKPCVRALNDVKRRLC